MQLQRNLKRKYFYTIEQIQKNDKLLVLSKAS